MMSKGVVRWEGVLASVISLGRLCLCVIDFVSSSVDGGGVGSARSDGRVRALDCHLPIASKLVPSIHKMPAVMPWDIYACNTHVQIMVDSGGCRLCRAGRKRIRTSGEPGRLPADP